MNILTFVHQTLWFATLFFLFLSSGPICVWTRQVFHLRQIVPSSSWAPVGMVFHGQRGRPFILLLFFFLLSANLLSPSRISVCIPDIFTALLLRLFGRGELTLTSIGILAINLLHKRVFYGALSGQQWIILYCCITCIDTHWIQNQSDDKLLGQV